jgi:hypothetical protein
VSARQPRSLSGHRILDDEAVAFRQRVIDALVVDGAAGYITADTFTGRCPVCGEFLTFIFHGFARRVDLICMGFCTEAEVAAMLGLELLS